MTQKNIFLHKIVPSHVKWISENEKDNLWQVPEQPLPSSRDSTAVGRCFRFGIQKDYYELLDRLLLFFFGGGGVKEKEEMRK